MIKTEKDIAAFEKAVDSCSRGVWLVAPDGKQYNMDSVPDRYNAIVRLLNDKNGEMEIFTSCYADDLIMMDFYSKYIRRVA